MCVCVCVSVQQKFRRKETSIDDSIQVHSFDGDTLYIFTETYDTVYSASHNKHHLFLDTVEAFVEKYDAL